MMDKTKQLAAGEQPKILKVRDLFWPAEFHSASKQATT
jgi:hypothetical protein